MIQNPVGKAKSVLLTEEGIAESEPLFREMFAKASRWRWSCHLNGDAQLSADCDRLSWRTINSH